VLGVVGMAKLKDKPVSLSFMANLKDTASLSLSFKSCIKSEAFPPPTSRTTNALLVLKNECVNLIATHPAQDRE